MGKNILFSGLFSNGGYFNFLKSFVSNIDKNKFYLKNIINEHNNIFINNFRDNINFTFDNLDYNSKMILFLFPHAYPKCLNEYNPKINKKFLFTMIEGYSLNNKFIDILNTNYDKIIVPSEFQKNIFLQYFPENKIDMVYPIIDSKIYNKNIEKRQKCNFKKINTNTFNVETVSDIKENFIFSNSSFFYYRKGIDLIVKSYLNCFSKEDVALSLFLKPYKNNPKSTMDMIVDMIVNNKINIKNKTPNIYVCEDLYDNYNTTIPYSWANCFVYPSRGEGIGLSVLESAACGIPIICSNSSSLSSYFNDDNSFVFNIDKIENIGEKILNNIYVGKKYKWKYDLTTDFQYNSNYVMLESEKIIDDLIDRMRFIFENKDADLITNKIKVMNDFIETKFSKNNANKLIEIINS